MAIKPKCEKCKKELKDFGTVLLSPPDKNNSVKKFHLCAQCYKDLTKAISRHYENHVR